MACCTKTLWTIIISALTIILCPVYIGIEIGLLIIKDLTINYEQIEIIADYFENEDKFLTAKILYIDSIVLNFLWVISSIILLIYLNKKKENRALLNSYIIWNIFAFLAFIPDVVGIILFSLDKDNKKTKTDAPLFLTIISTRFSVIILHILSWIAMIIFTVLLHKSIKNSNAKSNQRIVPLKPPKPALKPSKLPYLEANNFGRVRDWHKHYEENERNENNFYMKPDVVPRNNNYNTTNYPHNPPPAPPLPPPQSHQIMPSSSTNILINGVPSGTLRRQLPWSYMPNNPVEVPHFRRQVSASTVSSFSLAPNVPAPDYNVKNPRVMSRRNFNEPGWTQYL